MIDKGFHVARDEAKLDAFVTTALLDRLKRPDVATLFDSSENPEVQAARAKVAELKAELAEAMALWRAKKLSLLGYAEIEGELQQQITEAERLARSTAVPLDVELPAADRIDAWWDDMERAQRREIVGAVIAAVVVHPVGKGMGRKTFDPAAVTIEWRS